MLPKHFKLDLREKRDFFSLCKKKFSKDFSFFYQVNENEGLKITVVIPKKIVKLATKRNWERRRIFTALEEIIKNSVRAKEIKESNLNLVIVLKKSIKEQNLENLVENIERNLIEIAL